MRFTSPVFSLDSKRTIIFPLKRFRPLSTVALPANYYFNSTKRSPRPFPWRDVTANRDSASVLEPNQRGSGAFFIHPRSSLGAAPARKIEDPTMGRNETPRGKG